ncbi:MAG: ABC transporter permease [Lachnospiraceae bacterium]|nr:ABC transporter permease [Lachnospiraceae bacterium]
MTNEKVRARGWKRFYIALIFIFMYAPIFLLIIQSFNKSKSRGHWGGFTLGWYVSLFHDADVMKAFGNTILLAVISSLVAVVIGTMAVIAMSRMKMKSRQLWLAVTNVPMLNADIVTGVSLMLLFITLRIELGFGTVLLAHITFNIPYVILNILPRYRELNPHIYEAALDLGATPAQAFFKTVLPEIAPGITSGGLMAFTMSLDDFIITHFTTGAGMATLPTKIYAEVKLGIKPEMYALSAIIFVTVLFLLMMVNRVQEGSENKRKAGEEA